MNDLSYPSKEDERTSVSAIALPAEPLQLTDAEHKRTAEEWAKEKATPPALFAAVKQLHHWAIGAELTEAEFDDAVTAMHAQAFGGGL